MIPDPKLAFPTLDNKTHTYRIGDLVIPGVTSVIVDVLRRPPKVKRDVWESAQELGQLVHDATALYDKDVLDEDSVDDEVVPYLEAWKKFRKEIRPEIRSIERVVYHPAYRYAGTEDREIRMDGVVGTLDIKTGVEDPANDIQLAAYTEAKNYNKPYIDRSQRSWCLYLRRDGKFKLRTMTDPHAFGVFLSALQCYNWRRLNGNGE